MVQRLRCTRRCSAPSTVRSVEVVWRLRRSEHVDPGGILAVDTVDIDGAAMVSQPGAGRAGPIGIYDSRLDSPSGWLWWTSPMSVSSGNTLIRPPSGREVAAESSDGPPFSRRAPATFRGWRRANVTPGPCRRTRRRGPPWNTLRRATGAARSGHCRRHHQRLFFTNSTNVIPGVFWRTRTV